MSHRRGIAHQGGVAAADITTALAHWWHPSRVGNANDQVGSVHGAMQGGLTASADGWDMGTDDAKYVNLSGPIATTATYSIATWLWPDVAAMNLNANGGWAYSDRDATARMDSQILYDRTSGKVLFSIANTLDAFFGVSFTPTTQVWQHVVMTVSGAGGNLIGYLNGAPVVPTTEITGTPSDASTIAARIGASNWTGNMPAGGASLKWHGKIDNTRVYAGRVLEAETVAALYALGRSV